MKCTKTLNTPGLNQGVIVLGQDPLNNVCECLMVF